MKTAFQSKDLQLMFTVSKERITYLSKTFNIVPEVEEAEGTGRAQLYSFRNVLKIAFAHYLNRLGLLRGDTKRTIDVLDTVDRGEDVGGLTVRTASGKKPEIFDPEYRLPIGFSLFRVESRWPGKPEQEGLLKFAVMNDQDFLSEELGLSRTGKRVFGYHVLRLDTIKNGVIDYAESA